jgi:glycosyltransferase involved in cell wall biosynthesis
MAHVLHLTTWHPWITGVAGSFVLQQCKALSDAGVRIGLIFSRVEGLRSATFQTLRRGFPAAVRTDVPVPTFGFKSWNIPGFSSLIPVFHATTLRHSYASYVSEYGQPDMLHAHVALGAGPAAVQLAEAAGIEYVLTEHSSEILRGELPETRFSIAAGVYDGASTVIAVSDALAHGIARICPRANVRVIPNLIPDDVFRRRKPADSASGDLVVVTISHLDTNKRVHWAIHALSSLPENLRRRVVLHVVGGGPESLRLQKFAQACQFRTVFHGYQSHADAMDILSRADLLVHPSTYETFGVVLAEAAALGVPVVATRCGGPESVVTAETGKLVGIDDMPALCESVRDILANVTEWRSRRSRISESARRRFDAHSVSAQIIELYE